MRGIRISMSDSSFKPVYKATSTKLELFYSCPTHDACSSMSFNLPKGEYLIECYGASGGSFYSEGSTSLSNNANGSRGCIDDNIVVMLGGNTKCNPINNAGSGAYIAGFIKLNKLTHFFARIGGSGVYLMKLAQDARQEAA